MMTAELKQSDFQQEFLMARNTLDPRDFGIDKDRDVFEDEVIDAFGTFTRGQVSIDELVLHPREALQFCDDFRRKNGYLYLPDDIILRTIMTIRKRGSNS